MSSKNTKGMIFISLFHTNFPTELPEIRDDFYWSEKKMNEVLCAVFSGKTTYSNDFAFRSTWRMYFSKKIQISLIYDFFYWTLNLVSFILQFLVHKS